MTSFLSRLKNPDTGAGLQPQLILVRLARFLPEGNIYSL
ncbi:uncharacterized protein METZ01_LOCUS82356 [marine metagenome]|uniref:Uncharacterized protein n=1 Tax=marine metagenome TaxID=408172 RepID=A0A381UMX1_9ZZZZ